MNYKKVRGRGNPITPPNVSFGKGHGISDRMSSMQPSLAPNGGVNATAAIFYYFFFK